MTWVGFRWKSLKRHKSVEVCAGWKRSNTSRSSFPIALKSNLFCFFAQSPHLFLLRLHPLHIYSKSGKHSCNIILFILIVILFLGTFTADFNWQLEVASEVFRFSQVWQPAPLSPVRVMSLRLNVSNLPLKIPQQTSSAEQVVPIESGVLSLSVWKWRCHCVCSTPAPD